LLLMQPSMMFYVVQLAILLCCSRVCHPQGKTLLFSIIYMAKFCTSDD